MVSLLLTRGANANSHNDYVSALELAASRHHLEVCLLLLARGANLMKVIQCGQTALDFYGTSISYAECSAELRAQCRAALRLAFADGPHPSQVKRRNWERRWPFMSAMVGCGFQPLAARQAQLLIENPPLPHHVKIPPEILSTPAKRRAYYHGRIFAHNGFWMIIASYL